MKIKSLMITLLAGLSLVACNGGGNSSHAADSSTNNNVTSSVASTTITGNHDYKVTSLAATTTITGNPNLSGQFITSSYEQNGVLYIGTNVGLYVSADNGTTWSVINPVDTGLTGTHARISDVAVDGDTIYMLVLGDNSPGNYTLVSKDAGKTWQHFGTSYSDATSMFLLNHDIYLVYGGWSNMQSPNTSPTIKISHDQGNTWTTIASFENTSYILSLYVDKNDTNKIYFVDPSTTAVYGSNDNGKTWVSDYTQNQPTSVVASGNTVFVGTINGLLFSSEWLSYGKSCGTNLTCGAYFGTSSPLTTVNGLGANNIYKLALDANNSKLLIATANGYSVSTDFSSDMAPTFTNFTSSAYNDLLSSQVNNVYINNKIAIMDTDNGISVHNNSNQFNWTVDTSTHNVLSVVGDDNNLYSVNHDGMYIKSKNSTSTIQTTDTSISLYDNYTLSTYRDGNKIYVGSMGGISVSTDGGNTWSLRSLPEGSGVVHSVAATGDDVYAATYGGGLGISHDGGLTWNITHLNGNNDVVLSVFIDNGIIYAGTRYGGISISTDKGNTWKYYLTDRIIKGIFAAGTGIYAATDDGLYVSTDGAKNWSHMFDNKVVNSVFVSAGNIYLGMDDGSIDVSLDGKTFKSYNLQTEQTRTYTVYEKYGSIAVGNNSNTVYGSGV